jgi:hypothetical protein
MSYVRQRLFHGDNTGSNPVGDANKIKDINEFLFRAPSERDAIVTIWKPSGTFPLLCDRIRVGESGA